MYWVFYETVLHIEHDSFVHRVKCLGTRVAIGCSLDVDTLLVVQV